MTTLRNYGKNIPNFYLEYYTIPNDFNLFIKVLEDEYDKSEEDGGSKRINTEFYWFYVKGKYKNVHEKVIDSQHILDFMNKKELHP